MVKDPRVRVGMGEKVLEDWTVGGLDSWRTGQLEDWTVGGLDSWRTGQLEDWTVGGLEGVIPHA
jgi:hypothetical protein